MKLFNLLITTLTGAETTAAAIAETTAKIAETTADIAETTAGIAETTAGIAETTAGIAETTAHIADTTANAAVTSAETGGIPNAFWNNIPLEFTLTAAVVTVVLLAAVTVLAICLYRAKKSSKPAARIVRDVSIGKLHEQGAREYQQDCFAVSDTSIMYDRGLLAVVADGMGGLEDGDKVSQTIVEAVLDTFLAFQGQATHEETLLTLTSGAVKAVDRLLGPNGYKRCGSTLIMGYMRGNFFSFVSVGDSRICLYRDGMLLHLNREHIYKNELALKAVNGELTLQNVYTDKRGSGLTSFVGMGKLKYIDMPASPIEIRPGDKIMLMSDGIYNAIRVSELTSALEHPAAEAAEMIRNTIAEKHYQNQDNYTGIILECLAEKRADENNSVASAVSVSAAAEKIDVPGTESPEN